SASDVAGSGRAAKVRRLLGDGRPGLGRRDRRPAVQRRRGRPGQHLAPVLGQRQHEDVRPRPAAAGFLRLEDVRRQDVGDDPDRPVGHLPGRAVRHSAGSGRRPQHGARLGRDAGALADEPAALGAGSGDRLAVRHRRGPGSAGRRPGHHPEHGRRSGQAVLRSGRVDRQGPGRRRARHRRVQAARDRLGRDSPGGAAVDLLRPLPFRIEQPLGHRAGPDRGGRHRPGAVRQHE
ncbi:hypothetical protein LTR94_029379, partial [Friedmanniomyces endolithicus]